MKQLITSLFIISIGTSFGQTWSDDVAEIVYNKCSQCHHSGGVGPFSLITYAETSALASMIGPAVSTDEMPPWPPENEFQSYAHDRSLSPAEKVTMLDWILNGTPEGTPANTPPPPVYQTGSILGPGDLEVQIPTYMSKATASGDDYVCFAIPSNLGVDRVIKSIEVVPGNPAIVHHCLVYIDENSVSVTDTIGGDCQGPSSPTAKLIAGYVPGGSPAVLPSVSPLKLGYPMAANSQIYLGMHYPEGSYGEYDSTKVILHFYPVGETGIRELTTDILLDNWTFSLPPNQITNVSDTYPGAGGLVAEYSLVNVFPHMHLIGKSMKVYGIKPNLDTLKLINIPEWDFDWQGFYYYSNMQKAEIGTVLHADAVYDNTAANLNNPNDPPVTVTAGLNTADEMLVVFMSYMPYVTGDEDYNMDSLLNLSTLEIIEQNELNSIFSVYPNPFNDGLNIYSSGVQSGDHISVYIYNSQGQIVSQLLQNYSLPSDELKIEWNGKSDDGSEVSNGIYFLSINNNGKLSNQRIIKN